MVSLKETVQDRKLIRQALTEFNKHVDLHKAVDEWKLKFPAQKTWSLFKIHFTKAIIIRRKRGGTFRDIGIANNVQADLDANKENSELMAQVQHQQAQLINDLSLELQNLKDHQANVLQHRQPLQSLQPTTNTNDATLTALLELLQQNTSGSKTSSGGKTSTRRQLHNPNDLPNGERSVRHYPNSASYCSTCGFDLDPWHNSKTCNYKKKNPKHNDAATITDTKGGSTCNTFHYKKM